jgi:hypothetical protein
MKLKSLFILFFIAGILIANNSLAAIVNFTSDTIISLTGLTTSLYVKSGSSCDSLVVNGTSLTSIIPANASFILKGSSDILSVNSSVGDTTLVVDSSNFSSGYLNQWALTNLTTNSVNISVAVPPSGLQYILKVNGEIYGYYDYNSNGLVNFNYTGSLASTKIFSVEAVVFVGGGTQVGSTPTPTPMLSPTPTPTPTPSITPTPIHTTPTDPQSILNSLLQQLASLQQQLANQQTRYIFTKGIQYGDTGEDVTQLQIFLKNQGTDIYPEGLITGYFGNLTKLAVQRFQLKYNIAQSGNPGYGYVGPKTRAKINSL